MVLTLPAWGQSVLSVHPAPGSVVSNLTLITVTFSKPVMGVHKGDLMLNGGSGTNLTGSGAVYTFAFSPSSPGVVEASWNGGHNITDLSGNRLNDLCAGTLWQYTLIDIVPPSITTIYPVPGATLSHMPQIAVSFSESVVGVDASSLLVNEQPATRVSGQGAGPYTFVFDPPAPGVVQVAWRSNNGIRDQAASPNAFSGENWTYTLQPGEFSGNIVINEFLAANVGTNGLRDEDGDLEDWIEIHNRGSTLVNLAGWSLTDDPEQPGLWVFPAKTLASGHYLVVFGSGKDRSPTNGGNLHTSFKLSRSGQYLGLFNANFPRGVATQFLPAYPDQTPDVSYGLFNNAFGYLTNATPGAANSGPAFFSGLTADPQASVMSGLFKAPVSLTLSTPTPGASIRYTLDGSEPTATIGTPYTGPIPIAGNAARAVVNVRAIAFRQDLLCSRVVTHSYIFSDHVLNQPARPAGFPADWITQADGGGGVIVVPGDYQMDPRIITNSAYATLASRALTNLPTLSLVANTEDLFSQDRGIYANPNPIEAERSFWERAASAELILPNGSPGFRINAGLRVHGSTSRDPNWTRKHSLRLSFKKAYDGKLDYSPFNDSSAKSFRTLILSAGFNLGWNNRFEAAGARAQFVRDQFCSDLQLGMNHLASHGRFVHLYINGLYWGVYNMRERPDEDFTATYLGGDDSQYDVVKNGKGALEVVAGDTNVWSSMMALVNSGLSSNGQYEQLRQYLDVESFIDYMILNHYVGNTDWANHNWYGYRQRIPGAGFRFVSWDAELSMKSVTENVAGYNQAGSPTMIHSFLRNNAEYRLKFADRVHKQFFNGGPLFVDTNRPAVDPANPQRNRPGALYMKRIDEVAPATVMESARWGDSVPARTSNPFTRADFLTELYWMTNTYFPQRSGVVLNQYRTQLLYPDAYGAIAPAFNQAGGNVPLGFSLTMSAPSGTIYYTTNGSDPRVYGTAAVSPDARAYTGTALVLHQTTRILARTLKGTAWSPLSEATFSVAQPLLPLRITEIMYLPTGGQAYQFLEIQNVGPATLDLSGCSVSGVGFTFPAGFTIGPGAVIVLGNGQNPAAFALRYPGVSVAAWFPGNLASKGERIAINEALGRPVFAVNYLTTDGWPVCVGGRSIEINDVGGDPNDPANWRLSQAVNGTPGTVSALPPAGPVLVNEVMAINSGALVNGGTHPDWVELINTGASPANLAGWSLSDDGNPRKFVFPAGVTIPAGGFLMVFCDSQTTAPGLHAGFALSGQGEQIFLYNAQSNRVDGLSFGLQVPNLSMGRVNGMWQLTAPTPNAPNELAAVGSATTLMINEWLANSAPGQPDWLELYNPSSLPVPLRGIYIGQCGSTPQGGAASGVTLFQFTAASFLPAGGYVQLFADELPGPSHLNFKLPAEGGEIMLYDAFGTEFNRITYGPQAENISQGCLPDGSDNWVSFPGSASPGASNFAISYSGPRLNELMACNDAAVVNPWGRYSDWIELHNSSTSPFYLSGMSLSINQPNPGEWIFPAGTVIAAGGHMVIWCDGSQAASTSFQANLNAGQSLDGNSGGAYLFNSAGQLVDFVEYGFQIANLSIGRSGGNWVLLSSPTPAAANAPAATLGSPASLRFNEWMADPSSGEDWFELYSLNDQPVDLSGLYLTDDPTIAGMTKFSIAPLSFIAGRAWVLWVADSRPGDGRNHVSFKLSRYGDSLRLYGRDLNLLDAVDFGVQQTGVSEGRFPDGGSAFVAFSTTPTPGEGNYLPLGNAVINEVLTHTDPPLEDAIELANLTAAPLNIGGWYLSDSQRELKKFRIPNGTTIPAGGYKVFYQHQLCPNPGVFPSFALDSAHGDAVYLSAADANGNLTGYRAGVQFGAAESGVSFGRYTNSTGIEFVAMSQRTFGVDNPSTLAQFRSGVGLANAYPKVGPVVINELMYQPVTVVDGNHVENPDEEFIELYNLSSNSVPLFDPSFPANTWQLAGGISFSFPPGTFMAAQSHALVVSFDPATNTAALAAFRQRFGVATNTLICGPFKGRLSNDGESIELYKPDPPSPAPDAGFVPWILVDRVSYGITAPWPEAASGGGASLQRRLAGGFGNDPLNWKAESPTAGRLNQSASITPPVITSQPPDRTATVGASVTLSVAATGSQPVTYQWQYNGIDLFGATNAVLTIPNAQVAHSGSYRVWISNAAGSICSRAAAVSVMAPPVITAQPLPLAVSLGANVTLKVEAEGSTPMSFQWHFNSAPLPGATNSSLTLLQVDPTQAGTYDAVVSNPVGVAASEPATLSVVGVDSDGDGIPDSWMMQTFGHPTGLASDNSRPQDDADGDGMTNYQEYLSGTDTLDAQSCLKLHGVHSGNPSPQFSFTAVAAIEYTLQYSESPGSGMWHKLIDLPAQPATRIVVVEDPEAAAAPMRFYRVVTPIQP